MDDKNTAQGLGDELEQDANEMGGTAGAGANQVHQMFPSRPGQQKNPTDGSANPTQTDGTRPAPPSPSNPSADSPHNPHMADVQSPIDSVNSPVKDLMNTFGNQSSGDNSRLHGTGSTSENTANLSAIGNASADTSGGGTGAAAGTGSSSAASESSKSSGIGAQSTSQAGNAVGSEAASQAAANTASASSAAGGAAASGGAATGGATGGAAVGATAGATTGSAVAPGIGTAVGAVLGVVLVEGSKILFKVFLALMIIISIFTMLPSSLFDKAEAMIERDTLEKVYTSFYESFEDQYRADIADTMDNKANTATQNNNSTLITGEGTPFDTEFGRVELKGEYLDAYNSAFAADEVEYSAPVYSFPFTREQYLSKMTHNINMMICMTDVQKKNWFVQVVVWILDSVTGGWFSDFTEGLSRKWEGFWVDYIALRLNETTATVVITEREVLVSSNPDRYKTITVATVTFGFVYDLHDKGVAHFAEKMALTDEQYERAVEMAGYLGELFGTEGEYIGWDIEDDGEHYTDPLPGGGTGDKILAGTSALGDRVNDFHWNPDAPTVFPLPGYSGLTPTSRFGPRNYARDPYHTGTDFSFSGCKGTPVVSVQDGIIIMKLAKNSGFGNHLVVYHGDGIATMYAHMDSFGSFNVGDTVKQGDTIGYVGTTGESTGPHLHIEFRKNGTPLNPVGNLNCFDYLLQGG